MPTVKVRNLKNKEVGEVTLSDAVFGVELNDESLTPGDKPRRGAIRFGDWLSHAVPQK